MMNDMYSALYFYILLLTFNAQGREGRDKAREEIRKRRRDSSIHSSTKEDRIMGSDGVNGMSPFSCDGPTSSGF